MNPAWVPVLGLPKLTLKRLPEGSRESANVLTMLHAGARVALLNCQFPQKRGLGPVNE
jgi:hypothetical protein